jgi:hypothetical protein
MIQVQFVRGASLSSAAIEVFSAGHLSHVDLVLPDGNLLGARSDAIGGAPPGVQIRPPGYEKWLLRVVFSVPATDAQALAFWNFARAQVGKPYDKLAIFAFVINRNWRDDDAWFCSELCMRCFEVAGVVQQLFSTPNKITPVMAANTLSAVPGVTYVRYSS